MDVVECDRDIRSDLLISRFKGHDRVVSRQTLDVFNNPREMCMKLGLRCVMDETVREIMPRHGYIRCTIVTEEDIINVVGERVGFYWCNFVNAREIIGAHVCGESTSFAGNLMLIDVRLPFSVFTIRKIRSSELNAKMQSKDIVTKLMTLVSVEDVREDESGDVIRSQSIIWKFIAAYNRVRYQAFLKGKIIAAEELTGMSLSIELIGAVVNSGL